MSDEDAEFDDLMKRSSLGASEARRLIDRTPPEVARRAQEAARPTPDVDEDADDQ
ncbi:hypothetical protein [Streptomyces chryseus]|uniref:hypothetical protein n=1 Tax=Streptomyces chryseus TaxID=68186 RepID=UPI00142ED629|nr:hypothetical protein [Streptomyces chryseus]